MFKMRKVYVILLFFLLPVYVFCEDIFQSKVNTYTQLLISEWELLKNENTEIEALKVRAKTDFEIDLPQNLIDLENTFIQVEDCTYLRCFIRTTSENSHSMLEKYKAEISSSAGNIYSCRIPYDSINSIIYDDELISIEASRPTFFTMDAVREFSNINEAHNCTANNGTGFTGKGVIVGMVDVGFDFTHPNFYDPKGENFRIKEVWCQSDSKNSTQVSYGAIYSTKEDILNKGTDSKTQTHGTHTAGIAAGGGYTSPYKGVAPESDIVLVATNLYTKGILDGISYIISKAKEESKPCVINLSLGSKLGPKDGTSSEDVMMDNLVGPGVVTSHFLS